MTDETNPIPFTKDEQAKAADELARALASARAGRARYLLVLFPNELTRDMPYNVRGSVDSEDAAEKVVRHLSIAYRHKTPTLILPK